VSLLFNANLSPRLVSLPRDITEQMR